MFYLFHAAVATFFPAVFDKFLGNQDQHAEESERWRQTKAFYEVCNECVPLELPDVTGHLVHLGYCQSEKSQLKLF